MIVEYGFDRDTPVIHRYVRRNGECEYLQVHFEPYFYIPEDVDLDKTLSNFYRSMVDRVELVDKYALDGTKVKKIYTKSPKQIRDLRKQFKVTYEADVPFTTRYMLDEVSIEDFGDPYKVMYLDIEIDAPMDASFDKVFNYPIICMTAICDGKERVFTDEFGENKMLEDFIFYVDEQDPDIIAGWNIDFDIAGIIERAHPIGKDLSRLGYVRGGDHPKIPGRIIFDLCSAYKKMMVSASKKPESYSLNFIAGFEFQWEMEPISRIIGQVYKEDVDKAVNYNRMHTKLCEKIDRKLKLTETFTALQKIALCEFRDTRYDSTMFDRILLRRSDRVLPTKPEYTGEKTKDEEYQGAIVFDPEPGLYEDIHLFDFKSLYPTAVLSLNISPETLRLSREESDYWLDGNNVGFVAEPPGLMPSIISDFLEERAKAKALSVKKGDAYDLKQLALKINANACFSPDTDILTVDGLKNIRDVNIGDFVYSLNPSTGKVEEKKVIETQCFDFCGDMLHIKNKSIDFLVTPNHRFFGKSFNNYKEYIEMDNEWIMAKDLLSRKNFVFPVFDAFYKGIKTKGNWVKGTKKYINKVPYNGKVFCVTVEDNHTVFAGRNHKFQFVGQSYGSMGFKRFRLYNKKVASSITYAGRESIKETKKFLESMDIRVIYGDSDSVFVTGLKNITPEELVEKINKHIAEYFSTRFGVRSSHIEIEYEGHYKSMFFGVSLSGGRAAKKRYAGLTDDGEMHIKGLEVKRRNCPVFGRNLQENVLRALLEGRDENEVVSIARDVYQNLIAGEYSIQEMSIPMSLSKPIREYEVNDKTGTITFAWAQAVVDSNREFNVNYNGQEPDLSFIYLRKGIRAFLPEHEGKINKEEVDYSKLTDMAITRRIQPVFDGMGWPLSRVIEGRVQTNLQEFL